RSTSMSFGSRPSNLKAGLPIEINSRVCLFIATTDGSFKTTPSVGINTIVLTVPKSIAKSSLKNPLRIFMIVTSQTASSHCCEIYAESSNTYANASTLPTAWPPEETLCKVEKRNLGDFPDSRVVRSIIGQRWEKIMLWNYGGIITAAQLDAFVDYKPRCFLLTISTRNLASRRATLRAAGTEVTRATISEVVVRIVI